MNFYHIALINDPRKASNTIYEITKNDFSIFTLNSSNFRIKLIKVVATEKQILLTLISSFVAKIINFGLISLLKVSLVVYFLFNEM
jgi:hypothetical protein